MGRGKVSISFITNRKKRVREFERRKKSLEKGASDLSTLCGVDIGMIIYRPADSTDHSDKPAIWPRNEPQVLTGLIESYISTRGFEGRPKEYGLCDFFKDKAEKAEDLLKKQREKTRAAMYPMPHEDMFNCMTLDELEQFHGMLVAKIEAVRGRINEMKGASLWNYDHNPQAFVGCDDFSTLANDVEYWVTKTTMMMNHGGLGQGQYGNFGCEFVGLGVQDDGGLWTGIDGGCGGFDGHFGDYTAGFETGFKGHFGDHAHGFETGLPTISYQLPRDDPVMSAAYFLQ